MVDEPELKFRSLSEAVVLAALLDPDPENPISREVRRLAAFHAERMAREMKNGDCPETPRSRWPIEEVALQLAKSSITGG